MSPPNTAFIESSTAVTEQEPPPAKTPEKDESVPAATPSPNPTESPSPAKPSKPQMGNTRVVDGQKQVYFLGFGWIEDNGEPNHGEYAADMYENGNKIGVMDGGTAVDGDGNINKMVGIMGE